MPARSSSSTSASLGAESGTAATWASLTTGNSGKTQAWLTGETRRGSDAGQHIRRAQARVLTFWRWRNCACVCARVRPRPLPALLRRADGTSGNCGAGPLSSRQQEFPGSPPLMWSEREQRLGRCRVARAVARYSVGPHAGASARGAGLMRRQPRAILSLMLTHDPSAWSCCRRGSLRVSQSCCPFVFVVQSCSAAEVLRREGRFSRQ